MGQSNAEPLRTNFDFDSELKQEKIVVKDGTGTLYLVDRHEHGTFNAMDIKTGKTAYLNALDLDTCSIVTQQEIEKLGIKID